MLLRFSTLFLLLFCATAGGVEIKTSPNDHRDYRYLELANGLRAVLVSDTGADQAAAALSVAVGSHHDPEAFPGLAHFLEHMLFLGTEKYPEPDGYQRYIARHGGSRNAYTAAEHTTYFFSIKPAEFEGGLDRLSRFFIDPLFSRDYVERERNAVHAEYSSKLEEDGWRMLSVKKALVDPRHPQAKFNIGNLETLTESDGIDIHQAVVEFYHQYYSAERMTLTVVGPQSLDALQALIESRFAAIAQREVAATPRSEVGLMPLDALPRRAYSEPLRELRRLHLSWPTPSRYPEYRIKAWSYVANLIGHEGPGSVLALLRDQGWANGLSAGRGTSLREAATFDIDIDLTEEGVRQRELIIALVFHYLDLIAESGVEAWRYEEQAQLAEIAFRFKEASSELGHASGISSALLYYPAEDVVRASYAYDGFDAERIRAALDLLRPERLTALLVAPDAVQQRDEVQRTAWFDVPYHIEPGFEAVELAAELRSTLHLPKRNPYIPRDLSLIASQADEASVPQVLAAEPGLHAWYLADAAFGAPRLNLRLSLRSPQANATPRQRVLTELLLAVVNDRLQSEIYPAQLVGLDYQLAAHARGLGLSISGYNDRQSELLLRILTALRQEQIEPQRLERMRTLLARHWRNSLREGPLRRVHQVLMEQLVQPRWSAQALLAEVDAPDAEAVAAHAQALLAAFEVEMLLHGNVERSEAESMLGVLRRQLLDRAQVREVAEADIVRLPAGQYRLGLENTHADSAITWYFQGQDRSWGERAAMVLLNQLMQPLYFQQLRTEQQLGYIVQAYPLILNRVPGMALAVQSPSATPEILQQRSATFLQNFRDQLTQLETEHFDSNRSSLISRLQARDDNLNARTGRLWREIDNGNLAFNSREHLVAALQTLDREALLARFDALFAAAPHALMVWARGAEKTADEASFIAAEAIDNPDAFKARQPVFPPEGDTAAKHDAKVESPTT